jgi:hypothetical protein
LVRNVDPKVRSGGEERGRERSGPGWREAGDVDGDMGGDESAVLVVVVVVIVGCTV